MIKGVNKNVIEIFDTGNESFERVILFVRADRDRREANLTLQAREYISALKLRHKFYRRGRLAFVVTALISAACGAAVTAAFFLLL